MNDPRKAPEQEKTTHFGFQDVPESQKADKPEAGKLDLAKLTASIKAAAKKADKEGVSKTALFNAIISDVFSPDDIMEMLTQSVNVNKVVGGELKDKAVPDEAKAA